MKQALVAFVCVLGMAAPAASQSDPKASYDELCASCHRQPQRLAARLGRTAEARAKLDTFLTDHYAQDSAKRAAVIDYLYAGK